MIIYRAENNTSQPNLRKTPRGGRKMAKIISMAVTEPSFIFEFLIRKDIYFSEILQCKNLDCYSSGCMRFFFSFFQSTRRMHEIIYTHQRWTFRNWLYAIFVQIISSKNAEKELIELHILEKKNLPTCMYLLTLIFKLNLVKNFICENSTSLSL